MILLCVMDYLMHMYVYVCIAEESCGCFAHFYGLQDTAKRIIPYSFVNAYIHLLTQVLHDLYDEDFLYNYPVIKPLRTPL